MFSEDMEGLVSQIRDHYVAQFRAFIQSERGRCRTGAAEVKFGLPEHETPYHRIAVVDFVRNDHGPEGILFEPESILTFDRIVSRVAAARLEMAGLRWDGAIIDHDAEDIEVVLEEWFTRWFDPEEVRLDPSSDISNCIHAVYIAPGELQVDFGTAPPEAFWRLLDSLADEGVTFLKVRS